MPKGKKRAKKAVDGPKPKRMRVGQAEQEVQRHTLTDLPVELCIKIFYNLDALDLLRVARVNKAIRDYLMRASMSEVWHAAAKRESAKMPKCPNGMTLPGWLSLILEKHCRFCGVNGVRKVTWELKTRACKDCLLESPDFRRVSVHNSDPELDMRKLQSVLPSVYVYAPAQHPEPSRSYWIFLEEDLEEFVTEEAKGGEAYANWVSERASVMQSTYRLNSIYHEWYSALEEEQRDRRYQEGAQLRRGQIKSRLAEEGRMDDLQVLERDLASRGSRFKDHPLFAKGGPLKDSDWKWVRPHILGVLKDEGARMANKRRQPRRTKRACV